MVGGVEEVDFFWRCTGTGRMLWPLFRSGIVPYDHTSRLVNLKESPGVREQVDC